MAKEKKNTAYDRKGAFRKWILCTKRKDRQKKKHLIRQTNASSSSSSSSTYAAHATQPTSNLLCQKKKKIQSTYTNQTQYYMFNKLINKLNQTKKKMKNEIQC